MSIDSFRHSSQSPERLEQKDQTAKDTPPKILEKTIDSSSESIGQFHNLQEHKTSEKIVGMPQESHEQPKERKFDFDSSEWENTESSFEVSVDGMQGWIVKDTIVMSGHQLLILNGEPHGYGNLLPTGMRSYEMEDYSSSWKRFRAAFGRPVMKTKEMPTYKEHLPGQDDPDNKFKDTYFTLEQMVSEGILQPHTDHDEYKPNTFQWYTANEMSTKEFVEILRSRGITIHKTS